MFYEYLRDQRKYEPELQKCIEDTVDKLLKQETDATRPGMLLGKIQSGKTRAFIGIVGLAFDKGYDVAVILTKGTRALAEQTHQRLESEFDYFVNMDDVKVYNIMNLPPDLSRYIRSKKLIFIVKKEQQNMKRLTNLFFTKYPDMGEKQVLLIDDEADFASIGYRKSKEEANELEYRVLAQLINDFRKSLSHKCDFLQVTATPYSLYLQPEEIQMGQESYKPMRPMFTTLVPIHSQYVGGEFYFEKASDPQSIASHLHITVDEKEFDVLRKRFERYLSTILETGNLEKFRMAFINFVVGGSIRMLQETKSGRRECKCSFIIHTESGRRAHTWQFDLASVLKQSLTKLCEEDMSRFSNFVSKSYEGLSASVTLNGSYLPPFEEVLLRVKKALLGEEIGLTAINSDNDIRALLNKSGQLRLDNPFNIFIGGQILDRGITIDNLIGFFYGRNPKRFQQDTVLQHSRMYGARPVEDLTVTRFYTSPRIYGAMQKMHEFDTALRKAFEEKQHTEDVVFIRTDKIGRIVPCAPGKILISNTTTLKPHKRLLPIGIQTKAKSHIHKIIQKIEDDLIFAANNDFSKPFLLELDVANNLIDTISSTYEWSEHWENADYEWDTKSFKAAMQYVSKGAKYPDLNGKVFCLVKTGRDVKRFKNEGATFSDAPDDGKTDLVEAKNIATEIPCLILLKQKGSGGEYGWRDAEFWWPVLVTPANTKTSIFATEFIE